MLTYFQFCFDFLLQTDINFIQQTFKNIRKNFQKEIFEGIIEVISIPANFYPNFSELRPTLNDSLERVKWRTKQNFGNKLS